MPITKEYITLNIEDIIPYKNNPRINDDAVAGVVESIKQCGELDPIEVDENNVILSGHTRLRAYEQLKYKQVSVLKITGLTESQKRKYRLLTNKTGEVAAWDFDKLGLELEGLDFDGFDFGLDVDLPSLEEDGQKEQSDDVGHSTLTDKFIVPPFSILDTRKGYWQNRKKAWKDLGIKSEVGRDAECMPNSIGEKYGRKEQNATSIFDPVLCEIMYKWYCPQGGQYMIVLQVVALEE